MTRANKAPRAARMDAITAEVPAHLKGLTKSSAVLTLMQRDQGATLAELVEETGWQPHTTRAMLTGLRKKGHAIGRRKRDGVTFYHLPHGGA